MNEANETKEKYELVDSHAHLDSEDFNTDRNQVVERASQVGVRTILCPAEITSTKSLEITFKLTAKYDSILAAAGVHPHKAKDFSPDCAQDIRGLASKNRIVAVGEIGLDFHYSFSPRQIQIESFRHQLNIAQELSLPVIVHSRKAGSEILSSVKEENFHQGGILHCFTEEWEMAKEMLNFNFLISFSGILTLPKAHALREVAKKIPLERLLVETDSPYLVPAFYRGKTQRNEPSFLVETAKVLAELKKIPLTELSAATTRNFNSVFKFEKKHIR